MTWYWLLAILFFFNNGLTTASSSSSSSSSSSIRRARASTAMKIPLHAEAVSSNGSPALYIQLSSCQFNPNSKPLYSTDQPKSVQALMHAFGKQYPIMALSNLKLVHISIDDRYQQWNMTYHYTADWDRSSTTTGSGVSSSSSSGKNMTAATSVVPLNFSVRAGRSTRLVEIYASRMWKLRIDDVNFMPRYCQIWAVSYQKKIK